MLEGIVKIEEAFVYQISLRAEVMLLDLRANEAE